MMQHLGLATLIHCAAIHRIIHRKLILDILIHYTVLINYIWFSF